MSGVAAWRRQYFADPRAAKFGAAFGARLMPIPSHLSRSQRSWTPFYAFDSDSEPFRTTYGDWMAEWGWGINDKPAMQINLKSRFRLAALHKGQGRNIPLAGVSFKQCWIFNTINVPGAEGRRLLAAQRDTLDAILTINGLGLKYKPKTAAADKAALITAGAFMVEDGIRVLSLRLRRRGRDNVALVSGETEIVRHDESGRVVSRQVRRDVLRHDGGAIEDFRKGA